MMSEPLERFFFDFKKIVPPIRKGSVRLRVSPSGERGVWLDFANADVKALFDEPSYLNALNALAFVEIGQRRKSLTWREGRPKLVDPELRSWFQTYGPDGVAIPLYGPVGGFSQAGFEVNRLLVGEVTRLATASGCPEWLELFSGNGNLSLALAAAGLKVTALENDALAVAGLERSLTERPDLKVTIERADCYRFELPPVAGRGLLVDPPRSGLGPLLERLTAPNAERPKALLYVSCFTDVFVKEAEQLITAGYRLESLVGVDQFPHSPHAEWIAPFYF